MEKLSSEQIQTVATWFAAGASLDEIQKRIQAEFGIHLTYLDVRLLVADLPQPVEEEPVTEEGPDAASEDGVGAAGDSAVDTPASELPEDMPPPSAGGLSVTVDPLAPPGCIACGSVAFSDGQVGKWMLDQMGRLALSGLPQGYRPSPADNADFQPKLVAALQAKGLM